jgi:hypothetical protein
MGQEAPKGTAGTSPTKDTPAPIKDRLRHYYVMYSGRGGMTEQDGMENWNYASDASRGVIARRYPYNYQMGLGYDRPAASLPGAVDSGYWMGEQNACSLLARWRMLMEGKSWNQMPPNTSD